MLKKILKKISYKIIKYSGVQGNITHNFDEKLRRVTPKAFLDSIGFNLVEHCNLHCYSCDHFSQLAKKEYLDINVFEKDVKRLKEILLQGNAIYMGGGGAKLAI